MYCIALFKLDAKETNYDLRSGTELYGSVHQIMKIDADGVDYLSH